MKPNHAPSPETTKAERLAQLIERLRTVEGGEAVEGSAGGDGADAAVETGWRVGEVGVCLKRGVVHEWLGLGDEQSQAKKGQPWTPPLTVLACVAGLALGNAEAGHRWVMWIGREAWPHEAMLPEGVLERSLWVDLSRREVEQRLWAADLAMRCRAFAAVVVDASGFDLPATRRLQLAARPGRAMCLLARPPDEEKELSAASSRWRLSPVALPSPHPSWRVTLFRNKNGAVTAGGRPIEFVDPPTFTLEFDRVTGGLRTSAELVDQPAAAAHAPGKRDRRSA